MSEHLPSQLPVEPEYWEELARKIGLDAAGPLAAYAAAADEWYGVLSRRAPWLVTAAAAAILTLWLAVPPSEPSAALHWMERSLAPHGAAGSLVGGHAPPSVEALMAQFPPEFHGEEEQ